MKILITGGSGFIGSALIRYLMSETSHQIFNIDKLTYAAIPGALADISQSDRYQFLQADICDVVAIDNVFRQYQPDAIMHLAAESHVDRSIASSADFINTNIIGTYQLLQSSLTYWHTLSTIRKQQFRFHHISTDEVFGDLNDSKQSAFTEHTAYSPGSPYSASKAASDHLVRAWFRTYQLPIVISNCSNNYGPWQHPEKLIPKVITNALQGKSIPIYGDGKQIRDWLYIDDHVRALYLVLTKGRVGESYNIGAGNEQSNLDIIYNLCDILAELTPLKSSESYKKQLSFVTDRAGHDRHYAIDATKLRTELGWQPQQSFKDGLKQTAAWYLNSGTIHIPECSLPNQ